MVVVREAEQGRDSERGKLTGLAEVLRKVLDFLGGAEGQLVIVKLHLEWQPWRQGQWSSRLVPTSCGRLGNRWA